MGSSWSSAFSTGTTQETSNMLNTILRHLMQESDLRDMYSLADPNKCKEYIVLATSALEKMFATIRIDKGPDGLLFYQKIRGFQERNPDAAKQRQYCTELSFFFVRIFQVYAAICLSMMDSELPSTDIMDVIPAKGPIQRASRITPINPTTGIRGFTRTRPLQQQGLFSGFFGTQSGGDLDAARDGAATPGEGNFYLDPNLAGVYTLLNRYLVAPANRALTAKDNLSFKEPADSTNPGYTSTVFVEALQDELYDFDQAGARIAVQNFTAGDICPRIIYKPVPDVTVSADLKLELEDADVTLKITIQDAESEGIAGLERKTATQKIAYNAGKPESFIQVLDGLLSGLYTEATKPPPAAPPPPPPPIRRTAPPRAEMPMFSAVDFLQKRGILTPYSTGEYSRIGDSNVYVLRAYDYKGSDLQVIYTTGYKLDTEERSKRITIRTNITMNPSKQRIGIINLGVDMDAIETDPPELKEALIMPWDDGQQVHRRTAAFTDSRTPVTERGLTISGFLEETFNRLLRERDQYEEREGITRTRGGLVEPYNSSGIPGPMRIKELWKALAKDPPVKAHCVARAMQLLNVAAIRGSVTSQGFSEICRTKFAYARDGSLPPAGKPITEEYGILSLAMLFVDGIANGTPQIKDTEKYKEFRRKFKTFFERYATSNYDQVQAPASLGDVRESLMPKVCEGHTQDRIVLDQGMVGELRGYAQQLLQRQADHLRNCMAILFKLFDEASVRAGEFKISAYVERDGTAAVNAIAEEAREMLMSYYGDCEETYKNGLFALYNKYKEKPEAMQYQRVE